MAGISTKALGKIENKVRFNGYEQQKGEFSDGTGLDWYDYKNRFYDNQIGRFFCVDRLASEYVYYSPYQFAGNEVPNAIDLDGLEPWRYTSPKQALSDGLGQMTMAAGKLIDKVRGFISNKTEGSTTSSHPKVSSVSVLSTTKSAGTNLGMFLENLKTNGYDKTPLFTVTDKTESWVEMRSEVDVKGGKASSSISVDRTRSSTSMEIKDNPLMIIGMSTSTNSTTGESKIKYERGVGITDLKFSGSV